METLLCAVVGMDETDYTKVLLKQQNHRQLQTTTNNNEYCHVLQ